MFWSSRPRCSKFAVVERNLIDITVGIFERGAISLRIRPNDEYRLDRGHLIEVVTLAVASADTHR